MKQIFQLFKLTLREKKRLIFALIFVLLVALFTLLFVSLIQPLIDEMFAGSQLNLPQRTRLLDSIFQSLQISKELLVKLLPFMIVFVFFGKGLFTFLSSFFMRSIGLKVVKQIRDELYEHIIVQSSNFFDHTPTGELMARVTNDVDRLQDAVSSTMGDAIRELFTFIALLVAIFLIDWKLSLITFIIGPIAIIPLVLFSRQLQKKNILNQEKMARIYTLLHETITGNKIIKAFTMEKFEIKKFIESTLSYFKTSIKLARIMSVSSPFMEFIGAIVGAVVLVLGVRRVNQGIISPGDFGAFLITIFILYNPIRRLSRSNNILQQGVACYSRIQDLMKKTPQIRENPQAYKLPPINGRVKYEHINFSYDGSKEILFDVNIEVLPAETVALVGLSGAGKTTFINLLSRLYDPTSGKITIDEIDIRDVTLSSLRSQIGLVTQDVILFNDTVRNNLSCGQEDSSFEKIIKAAKDAEAHGFITELPDKYDTQIGEKGKLLSGGQQQRLAIARALLKDPPILILDEATSSLDSESERLIQKALENLMKNRTTFVIAHRLSTIMNADKIVVIDRGRIVEVGTHKELSKKDGIYKRLYELQFPEEKET